MKFCKVLEGQDKRIPLFNHTVLRYKALKKKIKAIPKAAGSNATNTTAHAAVTVKQQQKEQGPSAHNTDESAGPLSPEERDFMSTLNEDVNSLNSFFMEKEEDAVISLQTMQDQLQGATDQEQLNDIKGRLVNFHGELVMILHWSLINYSAIVKILKKHDKRSGVLLRAPYLANVLTQPFSSTKVMSGLVRRAEELVEAASSLATAQQAAKQAKAADEGGAGAGAGRASSSWWPQGEGEVRGPGYEAEPGSSDDEGSSLTGVSGEEACIRRTRFALQMWQSLAKSASTPSTIPDSNRGAAAAAADVSETAPAVDSAATPVAA